MPHLKTHKKIKQTVIQMNGQTDRHSPNVPTYQNVLEITNIVACIYTTIFCFILEIAFC